MRREISSLNYQTTLKECQLIYFGVLNHIKTILKLFRLNTDYIRNNFIRN